MDYLQDEELTRSALRDNEAKTKQAFNQGKILIDHPLQGDKTLFNLLKKESISPRSEIPLVDLILLWQGPNFYWLAQELFTQTQQNQQAFEIFYLRTLIDAEENPQALIEWSNQGQKVEQQEYNQLLTLIEKNRLIYDVLQIASLYHLSPDPQSHKNRWLLIAQSLSHAESEKLHQRQLEQEQLTQQKLVQEQKKQEHENQLIKEKQAITEKKHEKYQRIEKQLQQEDFEEFATQDASLSAPQKAQSQDDLLIDQHSNWNQYIKPFLSENWLGLIGVGFIIAAWPILSMMVWDKSEYYRIAAGAIPLLFLTTGSAWIVHFFTHFKSKKRDAKNTAESESPPNKNHSILASNNKKPVQLFTCLTIWTIPFNFLMAISIQSSGMTLVASLMLLVYAITIWAISPWLKPSYGQSPRNYLLLSHAILIIPAIFNTLQIASLEFSIALMTYLAFFIFVKTLFEAIQKEQSNNHSFLTFLISIHLAILLIATHIFYVRLPAIGTVSVIITLASICLYYLQISSKSITAQSAKKATWIIACGAATILGNLLALSDPIYLLVTLLLSAIFWGSLSISQREKNWPIEVFAFHIVAYVAALQYQLELSQLYLLPLILFSGVGIWQVEKKLAQHEIKLLSFGIPTGLLLISFVNNLTGLFGIFSLMILMTIAIYNYYRCSQRYQIALWYISVTTLILIPMIHYFNTLSGSDFLHSNLAAYVSLVAIGWSIISLWLKDIPAQIHRTTMLWILTIVSTGLLFLIAIENHFKWDIVWFTALLLTIMTNILAAKRAQSLFPLYLAAALAALASFGIKHEFELISKSGIGSAILAFILVTSAPYLQKLAFFNSPNRPDRFFSSNFILHSKQYLRLPLEQFSWILIAVSFFKIISLFAPTVDNYKLSAACLINTCALLILAVRYQKAWLTTLAFLPFFSFIAAIIISIPLSYAPLLILTLFIGWNYLTKYSQAITGKLNILSSPIKYAHASYSSLFIFIGILAYAYLLFANAEPWQFFTFSLMSLFYIQVTLVQEKNRLFSHLNLLHIGILWTLFYSLNFYSVIEPLESLDIIWWLVGLMYLLFLPAYFMEWLKGDMPKNYHQAIQLWLPFLSILLVSLLITDYYQGYTLNVVSLISSLIILHCANRAYHHWLLLFSQWLVCCLLGYYFIPNNIYALLSGSFIFSAITTVWHNLSRIKWLHLQGISELNKTPIQQISVINLLGVLAVIGLHFITYLGIATETIQSIWLFSLLPLWLFSYRILQWQVLTYAFALIFAYCNIFLAIGLNIDLLALGLNQIHLICGALMVTILCIAIAVKILPAAKTTVLQEAQ